MLARERLRKVIDDSGMTLKDFSAAVGANYRTLQQYLAGDRSIGSEFLEKLSDQMNISASWVLTGKGAQMIAEPFAALPAFSPSGSPDFIPVQRFDVGASAGHGSLAEAEIGTGHYAFNRKWLARRGLSPAHLAVIAVRGDSMEPELHDQDLILLDRAQRIPRDGDIYVVRYSGHLFVKRVQVIPDNRVELRSANRSYGPITVAMPTDDDDPQPDLEFIGRVVASMHEW